MTVSSQQCRSTDGVEIYAERDSSVPFGIFLELAVKFRKETHDVAKKFIRFWTSFAGEYLFLLVLPLLATASPTKPTILYYALVNGKWDIYTMEVDGKNERRLTDGRGRYITADWSPDGRQIVFASFGGLEKSTLVVMDCDGTHIQQLPTPGVPNPSEVDWSPDGTHIAFSAPAGDPFKTEHDIFVLDLPSGVVRRLTNHPGRDETPSWSPNSQWLVFESNRDPNFWVQLPDGKFARASDLYIMDAQGNNLRNLTQSTQNEWLPAWSPDGTQIAFTRAAWGGDQQLYVMDVEGGKPRQLTHFKGGYAIMRLSWSPDSQQIIFSFRVWDQKIGTDIYIIDRDGTNLRQITDNNGVHMWGPRLFDPRLGVSSAGKYVTTWGEMKQKHQ